MRTIVILAKIKIFDTPFAPAALSLYYFIVKHKYITE
jgi:hypothetical protein